MTTFIGRREFISLLGGAAVVWPLVARAPGPAVPLIGFLNSASPGPFVRLADAFRQGLREGGYVEGRNVTIEYRWADGQFARLPKLAADLVHRQVSLIVATGGTVSARAAKEATATIPILFIVGPNPIGDGLVTSLNRPGGNATGVALYTSELLPKRLELLGELLPRAATIALLVNPSDAAHELETKDVEDAMRVTGQQIVPQGQRGGRLRTRACLRRPATGRRAPGQRQPILYRPACPTCRARGTPCHARRLSVARICRRWWVGELWSQYRGGVPCDWAVCQPHPQRRAAGRPTSAGTDEVRTGHQSQDRQGARSRNSTDAARPRRRGDRIKRHFAAPAYSRFGTKLPIQNVRSPVANGGKADNICSLQDLPVLTDTVDKVRNRLGEVPEHLLTVIFSLGLSAPVAASSCTVPQGLP